MAFTYQLWTARGQVRFALRDTDSANVVFQDDEIDQMLVQTAIRHFVRLYRKAATAVAPAFPEVVAGRVRVKNGAADVEFRLQSADQDQGVAFADLAVDAGDATLVSSAGDPFTAGDVGRVLDVTGGVGFTVGQYDIVSEAAGVVTLDREVGAVASVAGEGRKYAWTTDLDTGLTAGDYDTVGELVSKIGLLGMWVVGVDEEADVRWLRPSAVDREYTEAELLEIENRRSNMIGLTKATEAEGERIVLSASTALRLSYYEPNSAGDACRRADLRALRRVKAIKEDDMSVDYDMEGGGGRRNKANRRYAGGVS